MTTARTTAPRTSTIALAGSALVVAALLAIGATATAVLGRAAAASSLGLVASAAMFVALVVLAFGDGRGWDAVGGSRLGRASLAVAAAAILGVGALLTVHPVGTADAAHLATTIARPTEPALGCVAGAGLVVAAFVARRAHSLPARIDLLVAFLGAWWILTAVTGLLPGPAAALALLSGALLQVLVGAVLVLGAAEDRPRGGRPGTRPTPQR